MAESEDNMKKSEKILHAVCVVLLVWFVASIINTLCHNMTDYNYAIWNMFDILCRIMEG